jgi:hypothetical protein
VLELPLRSLTYVSQATLPMAEDAFNLLGLEASRLNALDGVSGLLVFNGTSFCQTIEGAPDAIDALMERLQRDPRHRDIRIIADESIRERRFRSWDMQLLRVPEEKEAALEAARTRLDAEEDLRARERVYETVVGSFA